MLIFILVLAFPVCFFVHDLIGDTLNKGLSDLINKSMEEIK